VPINWQISRHTIPRAHHAREHHTVVTGCKVGVRLRLPLTRGASKKISG
jgi:hypothetical protein